MEINEISRLASYLRQNGDAILNSSTKLTLSSQLLQKLNEAFPLIVENGDYNGPSAFRVINTNNSKFEIYHDLAFLHDFIQKTSSLKITNSPPRTISIQSKDLADIKRFGILTSLELNKVPVDNVSGIQSVQNHLDTIVCIRCLDKLEDILKYCGSDRSSGFVWSELRKAVFSYNGLESLDLSLSYAPWLQTLDLSHNRLSNADPIDCLPNLKCLNLSYNLLQRLPTFHKEATHKLLVLVAKFNYIEDLSEVLCLSNLSELDLSCNCVTDHQTSLRPLLNLSSLSWLSLDGNPLSYHRKHRVLTAQCLHNNTTSGKFLLNGVPLSKSERLAVGTLSPLRSTQLLLSSHSYESSKSVEAGESRSVAQSVTRPQASRRSGKVREALISEQYEVDRGDRVPSSSFTTSSLEMSAEHLETKKQIETLRERFGEENWLHSRGGSCVQNILGLPQPPKPDLSNPSSPAQYQDVSSLMHQQILLGLRSGELPVSPKIVTPAIAEHVEAIEDFKEVAQEMIASVDSIFGSKEMSPAPDNDDSQDEDDTEMDEQVYPVQWDSPSAGRVELFLVLTRQLIKEKEISFGRTQQKWNVDSLLSCVRLSSQPPAVQVTFDTVRRDRQQRTYIMEEEDAQSLLRTLVGVLESRSLSAMHQTVFRCLNCSSQFSRERDPWSTSGSAAAAASSLCPNCGSRLVIQGDDCCASEPAAGQRGGQTGRPVDAGGDGSGGLAQSPSQSSIGSAASLDHSPEWPPGEVGSAPRCDSDIEVISNPSQSSIEVLDDNGTPIRKRSEERQAESAVVEREAPHPALTVGLTESSSSGSFTDSICTTYENRSYSMGQPRGSFNHSTDEREDATISEENESSDAMSKGSDAMSKSSDAMSKSSDAMSKSSDVMSKSSDAMSKSSEVIDSGIGRSVKDSESSTETEDALPSNVGVPIAHCPGNNINFTSVLEGLLQSVSSKLSQTPPAKMCRYPSAGDAAAERVNRVRYSYADLAQVDHRVKLHLYQHVFRDEHEQLTLLVRADVLQQANSSPHPSCVVFSTRKIYILRVVGIEGDDPEQWLKQTEALPLSRLEAVYALPWDQGVCLTFTQTSETAIPANFLILLQDEQRTKNFLAFLKGITLPKECLHMSFSVLAIDEAVQSIDSSEDNKPSCTHLAIYNQFSIVSDSNAVHHNALGVIMVSKTDLVLSMDNLLWLFPESIRKMQTLRTQKISNLIEVEVAACSLTLHFLDEIIDRDETWTVALETVESMHEIVAAIKAPWEELFLVPLQIMYKERRGV